MTINLLDASPQSETARALSEFEKQFVYPLGDKHFSISHGDDYGLFSRTIGDGCVFVCQKDGCVIGTVAVAIKKIQCPDGSVADVAYVCDLKLAPRARGGRLLVSLLDTAAFWCRGRTDKAFAVVMGGTPVLPQIYTGRLGIPEFKPLIEVDIFKIKCADFSLSGQTIVIDVGVDSSARQKTIDTFSLLGHGSYCSPVGNAAERSIITPQWFYNDDYSVCGCLEDTQKVKQLIVQPDGLIKSAHLSSFAFAHPSSGAALLRRAGAEANRSGFDWLFSVVSRADSPAIKAHLADMDFEIASATVYGVGFDNGINWLINSSEI